jgi:hypothetical protein
MEVLSHPEGNESLWAVAPEYDADFEVFGTFPVQAVGTVCGRDFRFEAIDDAWRLEVADETFIDGRLDAGRVFHGEDFPHAGWMSHEEAVEIIVRCLQEYTGVTVPPIRPRRRIRSGF